VTDPPLAVHTAQLGDDVVTRPPRSLVDDDQAVTHERDTNSSEGSSEGVEDTRDDGSADSSLVKPAAKTVATASLALCDVAHVNASSDRRLTRHVASGPCFNTHATSASACGERRR